MRNRFLFIAILSFLALGILLPSVSLSQDENNYYQKNIEVRKLDEQKWQHLTKDLDYTDTEIPEKPKDQTAQTKGLDISIGPIIKIMIYTVAIILLAFIILKLTGIKLFTQNKENKGAHSLSLEHLDEEIQEADLERFLKEVLNNKEYRTAIRIYYLIILKELSLRKHISWKKDKTNREYLYEMSQRENYRSFAEATRIFEKAWYGDKEIGESDYTELSPVFKSFVEGLKKSDV